MWSGGNDMFADDLVTLDVFNDPLSATPLESFPLFVDLETHPAVLPTPIPLPLPPLAAELRSQPLLPPLQAQEQQQQQHRARAHTQHQHHRAPHVDDFIPTRLIARLRQEMPGEVLPEVFASLNHDLDTMKAAMETYAQGIMLLTFRGTSLTELDSLVPRARCSLGLRLMGAVGAELSAALQPVPPTPPPGAVAQIEAVYEKPWRDFSPFRTPAHIPELAGDHLRKIPIRVALLAQMPEDLRRHILPLPTPTSSCGAGSDGGGVLARARSAPIPLQQSVLPDAWIQRAVEVRASSERRYATVFSKSFLDVLDMVMAALKVRDISSGCISEIALLLQEHRRKQQMAIVGADTTPYLPIRQTSSPLLANLVVACIADRVSRARDPDILRTALGVRDSLLTNPCPVLMPQPPPPLSQRVSLVMAQELGVIVDTDRIKERQQHQKQQQIVLAQGVVASRQRHEPNDDDDDGSPTQKRRRIGDVPPPPTPTPPPLLTARQTVYTGIASCAPPGGRWCPSGKGTAIIPEGEDPVSVAAARAGHRKNLCHVDTGPTELLRRRPGLMLESLESLDLASPYRP